MSFIHDVCISFRDSRTPNSSRSSSASSVSHIESNGPFNDLEESPGLISNDISDYVESSNDNEEDDIVSNYPISLESRADSTLVAYAALTILIIEKNISGVAFDALLSVLQVS